MDRYLEGELSGIELRHFMERLEQDAEFRHRVSLRNLMIEGIRQAADEDLQLRIEAGIRYRRPRVPVALKLLLTFLLVTGAGIILWNYTGVNSDADRSFLRLSWLKQRKSDRTADIRPPATGKSTESKRRDGAAVSGPKPEPPESLADTTGEALEKDSLVDAAGEIVVRKDQLLVALDLAVAEDVRNDRTESLENKVVERLNPSAGLVKTDTEPSTLETEFWISPVNYRGYRLHDNKLVLYGIDAPDRVRLERNRDRLLLKVDNEVYLLTESEDFQPYPRPQESARTENR
jgi:hypothetical protein